MKGIHYNVARGRFWQIFVVLFRTEIALMPALKNICEKTIIKIHMHQFAKQYSNELNKGDKL